MSHKLQKLGTSQATKPTFFNGSKKSTPFFQAKLRVNTPGDAHEQEADRVADEVMRMEEGDSPILQSMPLTPVGKVMRMCDQCAEEEKGRVRRKETGGGDAGGKEAPSMVSEVLSSSGGQPMDSSTRRFMEARFGQDFSGVRVHTYGRAAESAAAIQARAYTSGKDVVFGKGEYQPASESGRRLLAHELVHVGQQGVFQKKVSPSPAVGNSLVLRKRKKRETIEEQVPWLGRTVSGNVALRQYPYKDKDRPHNGTIADLPEGEFVRVIGRNGGWLQVEVIINDKRTEGYISQELVLWNRWDIEPGAERTGLTVGQALVILKRAETRKKSDPKYKPEGKEKRKIDVAVETVNGEPKYEVDETIYLVTFAKKTDEKITVRTIEDFVLFVEAVETQYPSASAKEIVSEIRQMWFSDPNWEVLVDSEGVKEGGRHVDIETAPNPIAMMFNMADLAPAAGGKVISTRMGNVDIGHVMAGIDARLSGGPASYPEAFLKAQGHDSGLTKFKYENLKEYNSGDPTAFATFAGDLGQAYAEFIYDRYDRHNDSAYFSEYINLFAKEEAILGDIHGYIAASVASDMRSSGKSPTGIEEKASSIIRDLYLIEKWDTGSTYLQYLEKASGRAGWDNLKSYIFYESQMFAHLWYAKRVAEDTPELWKPADLFVEYTRDFGEKSDKHEATADQGDTLSYAVEKLLNNALKRLM